MSLENDVNDTFDKLADGLDKVYDLAQGTLDEAFVRVDKFFGAWKERAVALAKEKDASAVEEEITLKSKTN